MRVDAKTEKKRSCSSKKTEAAKPRTPRSTVPSKEDEMLDAGQEGDPLL